MPFSSPKKLVLRNALILSILSLILSFVFYQFADSYRLTYLLVSSIIILISSYYLWNYSLEKFINERIRILYKTIRRQKSGRENSNTGPHANDALEKVEHDVEEWGKNQEEEIEQLRKLAQYRREFLGNVSHELKTPIFNIQGYILTLLDGGLDDPTINKDYLHRTEKSIDRLIAIVEDLEEISRLESGQMKLEFVNFDIVSLTKEVMEIMEPRASERNTKLVYGESYDRPVLVNADREKVRQVLTNLIDNSIKYGKKEGKTKVSFFNMDDHLLVEVADNGMGIDQGEIPRLFERFYRTDKARSREHGGSGLGLAIVKHIIEAHNQTINVRSSQGVGTTFGFTLKKTRQ